VIQPLHGLLTADDDQVYGPTFLCCPDLHHFQEWRGLSQLLVIGVHLIRVMHDTWRTYDIAEYLSWRGHLGIIRKIEDRRGQETLVGGVLFYLIVVRLIDLLSINITIKGG